MPHHVPLIATIAVGLAAAFVLGLLATRFKLPPLIGYLLAGIAVGPFTPGFTADSSLASQLAEIGVILLMFGVGMHFSLRDLMEVRRIALPGAVVQILVATAMGAGVAHLWGWSLASGLVFGLALSVASTVVMLKALEQRGMLDSVEGRIAVGWLVVEDLVMVAAVVILPVIAASLHSGTGGPVDLMALGKNLALVFGKIVLFFVIMHYVGVRVFPWIFARVAQTGSRELVTLFVIGVALGTAYGSAEGFGVSFALGAFFAGVMINESKLTSRIAAEAIPLENAFSVLFFVSVGMLFDPSILLEHPLQVLAVLGIIVVGKSFAAFLIVLMFRYPINTALTVSASLAQIGEFSFILAAMGVSLGLLPQEGQMLILAGALLSITLNPLIFRTIEPVQRFVRARPRLQDVVERPGQLAVHAQELRVAPPIRDHVVLAGYGRVGKEIGRTLRQSQVPYLVVEQNREYIERLRRRGIPAIFGDASIEEVLAHAHLETARVLVIATPDTFQARRMLEYARKVNPGIDTVVRTHSEEELQYFRQCKVGFALMAEKELANGMARYVLQAYETDPQPDSARQSLFRGAD